MNESNTYRHTADKISSERNTSEDIPIFIAHPPQDILLPNEILQEHAISPFTVITDHDYIFKCVLKITAYDYIPTNICTIHIHPVHGITFIFNVNTYSKDIEPDPPPHYSKQTLL